MSASRSPEVRAWERHVALTVSSLTQSDRDTLRTAVNKVPFHAKVGSLVGIGLGIYCAVRLRTMRLAYFNAFKAMERPVEIKFADGRTGRLPQ